MVWVFYIVNSYELSRKWFNWCFDNPEKIKPNHTALYFFCIEHCNRLGWQEKFGLPTEMAKSAIGIHSYNTYTNTLTDLIEWGFIKIIQKSKNQYSSNIIALSNFNKAHTEALDKAIINHASKQSESTCESIDSINKQVNKETNNKETIEVQAPHTAYKLCTEYWLKVLHPSWTFTAVHGKTMKTIIGKIEKMQKQSEKEITPETTATAFQFICSNLPDFFIDKDLQVINSKFNEIIEQIKNKSNGTNKNKQQSKYR